MPNSFFGIKKASFNRFITLSLLIQPLQIFADSKTPQEFSILIEQKRWTEAENSIQQLSKTDSKQSAIYTLQLAHAYGKAGLKEKAIALLELNWNILDSSNMAAFGWMLKARFSLLSNPEKAWQYFEKARALLIVENWPAEDADLYFQLRQQRDCAFDYQLESIERLINGGLQEEALTSIEKILSMLESGVSVDFNKDSSNGKSLKRHLLLVKAQLLEESKKPEEALITLDDWPAADESSLKAIFFAQDLNRSYIRGLCLLDLGKENEALSELGMTYESARQQGALPLVTLRAALALSQALHMNHETARALQVLDLSQDFIYQCPPDEQTTAHFAWTKQSVSLLIEVGQLHKAMEQIEYQLKLRHDPKSRAGLLLLKKELHERMNDPSSALNLSLELLSLPLSAQDLEECAQKILQIIDTSNPTPDVRLLQYKVAKLIISNQRPALCPKLRLEFSEWMLRQGLVNPQEMNPVLTQWLKELETGAWRAPSLYLLGQIQTSPVEKKLYFEKILEIKTLNESLKALTCAQIERLSTHPSYLKVENLIAIAAQSQDKTREMILSSALDIAIDHHLFQIDIEPLLVNIEPSSPVGILYQEWKLQQPLSAKDQQQAINLLKKGAERADLWGLRACTAYVRAMAQSGSFDQGIQALIKWSSFSSMHESLQRKALIEIADLYYRQNQMPQARKYISQIMEKWPQFDEKPWLQLRQYSEKEYMIGTAESRACLKDIQERYPQHPIRLIAASIEAKSINHINGPSVQSLKAWEDVLTAARAIQKGTGLDADAQETYVQALIEKTRCLEHIGMKKQALTSLKSVTNTASLHELGLSPELEHRLRLEVAIIEFDLGEVQTAQEQLETLWQDSITSKWQVYAALKLAEIKLWCGDNEDCLKILEKLNCHNEDQLQERLLLAARANGEMGHVEKRQAYLNELLKRPAQTLWQEEALWYVYLWNKHTQPATAEKALRALSKTSHPFALRAKNILSGQSLETPATSIRRTQ